MMSNAMDELFKRIKSGGTGLKQTGKLKAVDETEDPFDNIYDAEVVTLKRRITMSRRIRPKKNSVSVIPWKNNLKPVASKSPSPECVDAKPLTTSFSSSVSSTVSFPIFFLKADQHL